MGVISPKTLDEALALRRELPDAGVIAGGTDVMVAVNFRRHVGDVFLNLAEVPELQGWGWKDGVLRLGAGVCFTTLMGGELADALPALAQAARTVGSPQIRNRGTLGGNLGTASPAGDALPPLLLDDAEVVAATSDGRRMIALGDFLIGPKRNSLRPDELITEVRVRPSGAPQTFMKIGPRSAMVISVCSLALAVDHDRGEIRGAYGSAGPKALRVDAPLALADSYPDMVAAACAPIDDVRGTAAYRMQSLRVLARRAVSRCLG